MIKAILLILLSNSILFAQDQFHLNVEQILENFSVREADGNHVQGLGIEDFTLLINGQEMKIDWLEEMRNSSSLPAEDSVSSDAEVIGGEFEAAPKEPKTFFLVYDRYYTGQGAVKKTLAAARKIIEEVVEPQDYVGVILHNRYMRLLCPPTRNHGKATASLEGLKRMISNNVYYEPTASNGRIATMRGNLRPISPNADPADEEPYTKWMLEMFRETSADDEAYRLQSYMDTLALTAKVMERIPGKKALILMSGGPDVLPYAQRRYISWLEEFVEHCNAANVSLWSIDRGGPAPSLKTINYFNKTPTYEVMMGRIHNATTFAERTNGFFYGHRLSDEQLVSTLRDDLNNYYTLAFTQPPGSASKYQRIKIVSKNKDYKISHREGFEGKKQFADYTDKERGQHLEQSILIPRGIDQLQIKTSFTPIYNKGRWMALVSWQVPEMFLKDNGMQLGGYVAVENEKYRNRYAERKIFIPRNRPTTDFNHSFVVPLLNEKCRVSIAIRNNISGRVSTWSTFFTPPELEAGKPYFHEPVLLQQVDKSNWIVQEKDVLREAEDPLEAVEKLFTDDYIISNEIKPGAKANLLMVIGNIDAKEIEAVKRLMPGFVLNIESKNHQPLTVIGGEVKSDLDKQTLMFNVLLPLGEAEEAKGTLSMLLDGFSSGKAAFSTEYKIVEANEK